MVRQRLEGIHVGVLLHGRREIELGQQMCGVGQNCAEFRVRDEAVHIALWVSQEMRHFTDVQHVDLAACNRKQ